MPYNLHRVVSGAAASIGSALMVMSGLVTLLVAQDPATPKNEAKSEAKSAPEAKPTLASAPPLPSVALAFEGVTVIDVQDGRRTPDQTVIITGNRITSIAPSKQSTIPAGAQTIDARGKYLIPGLWDMHAHVDERSAWHQRFIANGITGVREMAQRFTNGTDSFRVWQREIAAGARVGPRAIGPSADLTNANGITIATPDDARRVIDSLKTAGIIFLKYHDDNGDPDLFFAMAREARRVGLPLVGHLSQFTPDEVASDSGIKSVEHAQENHQCWPDWPGWPEDYDSPYAKKRCQPVVDAYNRNGTWMTPTLVVFYYMEDGATQDAQKFLKTMHHLGFRRYLAGSDASQNGNILGVQLDPGFSLLQEIVLLVGGGLSPLEALQAGTLNPAKFLNATDSLGTVAQGKLADLALLDADPLTDIRNILKIQAVVANGRYYDRAMLDAMDPAGVERAKAFAEQQANTFEATKSNPEP